MEVGVSFSPSQLPPIHPGGPWQRKLYRKYPRPPRIVLADRARY